MSFEASIIGRHNAPLIGVAPLMRRAFAGEDLAPLGQILLERAQAYPNDAHAYMDFSTVLQLTGNRADALAVQAELDAIFAQRTLAQWTETFANSDCCVSPVLRTSEALAHPLFQARGMALRAVHASEDEYWQAGCPLKFSA